MNKLLGSSLPSWSWHFSSKGSNPGCNLTFIKTYPVDLLNPEYLVKKTLPEGHHLWEYLLLPKALL